MKESVCPSECCKYQWYRIWAGGRGHSVEEVGDETYTLDQTYGAELGHLFCSEWEKGWKDFP